MLALYLHLHTNLLVHLHSCLVRSLVRWGHARVSPHTLGPHLAGRLLSRRRYRYHSVHLTPQVAYLVAAIDYVLAPARFDLWRRFRPVGLAGKAIAPRERLVTFLHGYP